MLVLALDSTTRGGSVALARDGAMLEVLAGDAGRPHAERLPADLQHVLARRGLSLTDVDVFAVAVGPGSFTGLRIGIAAIQGCAFAAGKPVIGVSALEALAHAAPAARGAGPLPRVGVWMDAQRQEVFSALYRRNEAVEPVGLEALDGPSVGDPAETVARWHGIAGGASVPIIGDGAQKYRSLLDQAAKHPAEVIAPPPLAPTIAVLAWRRALAGELPPPHAIRPLYVRRPDAELARDRRQKAQ
jgi:tRNA threonylcarbamoyladenosine biosynthesis protein TsaB